MRLLRNIRRPNRFLQARAHLRNILEGQIPLNRCLPDLRHAVKRGGFSLEFLGTSEAELQQIVRQHYLRSATDQINKGRSRGKFFPGEFDCVTLYLEKAGATPEDAGSTADELLRLHQEYSLPEARQILTQAREKGEMPPGMDVSLWAWLTLAEATLEDIGSTDDERKTLTSAYWRNQAVTDLKWFRDQKADYEEAIRGLLRMINASFSDIGTSEEELLGLKRRYHLNRAAMFLEELEMGHRCRVSDLRAHLKSAGATPADIGRSEEELELAVRLFHHQWALYSLEIFRESSDTQHLRTLLIALEHADLTLADLGCSREEIARMPAAPPQIQAP